MMLMSTSPVLLQVSCLKAGSTQVVASNNGYYSLAMAAGSAAISSPSGAVTWRATSTPLSPLPRLLCLQPDGRLSLSGTYDSRVVAPVQWANSGPADLSLGPFTAQVTDGGELQVLDGSCNTIFSSVARRTAKRPPPPAKRLAKLPSSPRPSPRPNPGTTRARVLRQGALCGGLNCCGKDAPCNQQGTCMAGLRCVRSSGFTWTCRA